APEAHLDHRRSRVAVGVELLASHLGPPVTTSTSIGAKATTSQEAVNALLGHPVLQSDLLGGQFPGEIIRNDGVVALLLDFGLVADLALVASGGEMILEMSLAVVLTADETGRVGLGRALGREARRDEGLLDRLIGNPEA